MQSFTFESVTFNLEKIGRIVFHIEPWRLIKFNGQILYFFIYHFLFSQWLYDPSSFFTSFWRKIGKVEWEFNACNYTLIVALSSRFHPLVFFLWAASWIVCWEWSIFCLPSVFLFHLLSNTISTLTFWPEVFRKLKVQFLHRCVWKL